MSDTTKPKMGRRTGFVHAGRPDIGQSGPVNPPVMRASTVLYRDVETMRDLQRRRATGEQVLVYGRRGTSTSFALEEALAELEEGFGTRLAPSGLSANALVFLAYSRPGEHVLVSESVYAPVQRLARTFLAGMGIRCEFFASDGSDLAARIRPETTLIYVENPGSVLFELVDLRSVGAIARAKGITVAVDNTWGSGWLHRPLALGADVSVIAATKYIVGHSDVLLGAVVASEAAWPRLNEAAECLGYAVSPDDAYVALRGLRTLPVRMAEHERQALALIDWFKRQPRVRAVMCPALPEHPGHELWKRDFTGTCGLFSVEFQDVTVGQVEAFANRLRLFRLGASWGGFESLVMPEDVAGLRSVTDCSRRGPIVRFHAGLEDVGDLIGDLEQGFESLK
jgi:cystathionine beta-lyase